MIPKQLIKIAVVTVLIAAASGQLPKLIQFARVAQYQLLKDSQASKWGKPMLLAYQRINDGLIKLLSDSIS